MYLLIFSSFIKHMLKHVSYFLSSYSLIGWSLLADPGKARTALQTQPFALFCNIGQVWPIGNVAAGFRNGLLPKGLPHLVFQKLWIFTTCFCVSTVKLITEIKRLDALNAVCRTALATPGLLTNVEIWGLFMWFINIIDLHVMLVYTFLLEYNTRCNIIKGNYFL